MMKGDISFYMVLSNYKHKTTIRKITNDICINLMSSISDFAKLKCRMYELDRINCMCQECSYYMYTSEEKTSKGIYKQRQLSPTHFLFSIFF